MNDQELMQQITKLVDEEHHLLQAESSGEIDDPGRERMRALEVQLDQCWDLLRQRRGRRDFGEDPNEAEVRNPDTVEHYLQ